MQLEGGVGHAGDEAGHLEQVIDFGEIGVGKRVACEAAQDAAGGQRTGGEDRLGDLA